jgi:hypothetical protein
MGFSVGDTAAPSLTANERIHLLGQYTDLNLLSWTLSVTKHASIGTPIGPLRTQPDTPGNDTYIFSQPLPSFDEAQPLSLKDTSPHQTLAHKGAPPPPLHVYGRRWLPLRNEYTDGCDIDERARLGATVVHIPTYTNHHLH